MKLFILVYYFLRSVILRGPLKTYALWPAEQRGDNLLGVDTRHFELEKAAGLNHYQGASYVVLMAIFERLERLTTVKRMIDIGSGMGRVVFFAESTGFFWLRGIEHNLNLVQASEENLKKYKRRLPESDLAFVNADARTFTYPEKACIYFLFNPFGAEVLSSTLDRIRLSAQENCWFVYMNPLYAEVFEEKGFLKVETLKTNFYTEAIFYQLVVERLSSK